MSARRLAATFYVLLCVCPAYGASTVSRPAVVSPRTDADRTLPVHDVGFVALGSDLCEWTRSGVEVTPRDGMCRLQEQSPAVAYGRLDSPALTVDVDQYPFLTIHLKHDAAQAHGWTLALNNETPLTVHQCSRKSGVVSFDLRETTGGKGSQTFFLSLYVVGEGKCIEVDWIKIASHPLKASYALTGQDAVRGYVLYPEEPFAILTDEALPAAEAIGSNMSIFACPGEYEPATFMVYAARPLDAVTVKAGDLRGEGNQSIPADSIDIRVMKVWYQGGNGQAFGEVVLVPELLLKDDGLIGIDRAARTNIFSFKGIPVDGPALKPVRLPADSAKQFWLTVKVPEEATPGTYHSKVLVTPGNAPASEIELEVRVLPLELREPKKIYSIYYYAPHYYYYSSATNGILDELVDMRAHGLNSVGIGAHDVGLQRGVDGEWELDLNALRKQLDRRVAAGLTQPTMLSFAHTANFPSSVWKGNETNADKELLTHIIKALDAITEEEHYPRLFYYGIDEPIGDRLDQCAKLFEVIQKAGGKTTTAVYGPFMIDADHKGRVLDMAIYASNEADRRFQNPGTERNHDVQLHYWHPLENPTVDRLRYGLLVWRSGLDGACSYAYRHAYQGAPFQDESTGGVNQRNSMYTYPSQAGPIPTIQWEAVREGIDDVRYLTTLAAAVKASETRHGNPMLDRERKQGKLLLDNLPEAFLNQRPFVLYQKLQPKDFMNYRRQVAEQTLRLQALLRD